VITKPLPDLNEIQRAVEVIVGRGRGRIVEVRAPNTPKGTWSGYYNKGALIQDVFDLSSMETTSAVYWTIQEINPDLLQPGRENSLYPHVAKTTDDPEVRRYIWLPIDCDPLREGKVSSTDDEKDQALEVATNVRMFLNEKSIPSVLGDSGNGYHVLVPLDIPNQNGTSLLIEKVLRALNAKFSNAAVNVDTSVSNPSRVLKIYGSAVRKGEHTDERPWRTSRLVDVPTNPVSLNKEQLQTLLEEIVKDLPHDKIAEINNESPKKAEVQNGERVLIKHGFLWKAIISQCGLLWQQGYPEDQIPEILLSWTHENCEGPIDEAKVRSYAKGSNWKRGEPGREWVYCGNQQTESLPTDAVGLTENGIPIFAYPKDENESSEDLISITDLENRGDITVEYPDPGLDDLVSLFAAELVSGTSLPLSFARETLKNMTNQLLDGYFMHPNDPTLSLRGFHFNYGPSWIGKTKTFDWVLEWMRAEFERRGIWMRDLMSYGSRQYFVRMLSQEVPLDKEGKPKWKVGNPLQFLHAKEGNRIATESAEKNFKGIFSLLTDLYDQTSASTGSFSNDEWIAKDVRVSAIINITPLDFLTAFSGKGAIGSGSLPRWTISAPAKIENKKDWNRLPPETLAASFQLLRARLPFVAHKMLAGDPTIVSSQPIMLVEEADAKAIRLATQSRMEDAGKMAVRLMEYFQREQVNRAVFSIQHPNVMTAHDAERISQWTDAQLLARTIWPPDAGNPVERHEITIRRTVIKHLVSEAKLKDACNYYRPGSGGQWCFKTALKNMLEDDIKCVGVAGKRRSPVFCPKSCSIHPRVRL
jgi:hypothetical protein